MTLVDMQKNGVKKGKIKEIASRITSFVLLPCEPGIRAD